ncbi:MAG: type II toxin-antitoxin system RelE/ParE family toxin [Proteobacteria bacterium]|nr:type II toxin-antitoxin system RelE/ParE family toxin [Pseudomonadota bacterium]
MYKVSKTNVFMEWLENLRDKTAQHKISVCIDKVEEGNLGDHHTVGDGVSELRIHYGPGYRLYYTVRGREIIILLCGGDKSSQKRDIKTAKIIEKEV